MNNNTEKDFFAIRDSLENLISKLTSVIEKDKQYLGGDNKTTTIKSLNKSKEKLMNKTFQIAIVGLAKSGKSTLINSWLGNEFLPSAHIPETARIIRIIHNNKLQSGKLHERSNVIAKNAKEINQYLRKKNSESRKTDKMPEKNEIILEATIQTLKDKELGDFKFEILDTPGPNEAGKEILEASVHRILSEADVFIYLLDYTKLKTKEEKELWLKLKSLRSELLNGDQGRLFFVVNKIDTKNKNGSSTKDTAIYVSDMLKTQIDIDVSPENIIFVSAEYALLSRMVINCLADDKVLNDFKKHVFGTAISDEKIAWNCKQCRSFAEDLLKKSYMNELESKVIEFLFNNRKMILQNTVCENISKAIDEFENHLKMTDALIKQDKNKIESAKIELIKKKNSINSKISEIQIIANEFVKNINNNIIKRIDEFKSDMKNQIESINDLRNGTPRIKSLLEKHFSSDNIDLSYFRYTTNYDSYEIILEKFNTLNSKIDIAFKIEFESFSINLQKYITQQIKEFDEKFSYNLNQLKKEFKDELSKIFNIRFNNRSIVIRADYNYSETNKLLNGVLTKSYFPPENYGKSGFIFKTPNYSKEYYEFKIDFDRYIDNWLTQTNRITSMLKSAVTKALDQDVLYEIENHKENINKYTNDFLKRFDESIIKENDKKKKEERINFINQRLKNIKEIEEELQTFKKNN